MAQQERLFFLEDRDELWLTVKQRIAEISHSTPPLLWVTSVTSPASEWARHGRLQDLIFISSLLESRLSWSVTSWLKLSRQTVKQNCSWVDRKVHWDTKPEAMWTFPRQNVPVTVVKSVIGPCLVSKHSCTVKKWTVQTMRVMTGKENTELSFKGGSGSKAWHLTKWGSTQLIEAGALHDSMPLNKANRIPVRPMKALESAKVVLASRIEASVRSYSCCPIAHLKSGTRFHFSRSLATLGRQRRAILGIGF